MTREQKGAHRELLENAFLEVRRLRRELDQARRAHKEPIAVIGMGCRFPGGVGDPDAYWRLLRDGVDAVVDTPADRWNADEFYDPNPEAPGKMYCRVAGYLDTVDQFDAPFFDIPRAEAEHMDPQHRLLLEVAWEALEQAGLANDALRGGKTGVFMGQFMNDYAQRGLYSGDPTSVNAYNTLSNLRSLTAGRVAYALGVHGPAMEVDTACSSSLLAIHLACQSLRRGECELALAGGVNLILSPENSIGLCKMRAMSVSGRCRTFDAGADGYVRGEGCGVVVLKRLSAARADGDRVIAIVRGSAVNHDGPSNGLTAPNGSAQEAVIRAALDDAGAAPGQVRYVEAHGTGTALGDPIEAIALNNALGQDRDPANALKIGSVKTNFGHLESAAGVASFMKTALALHHGEIPPHLHFDKPSPYIPWETAALSVCAAREPWPAGEGPCLAGVSSFGMSGTNVHVILESAPEPAPAEPAPPRPRDVHALALAAKSEPALGELAAAFARRIEEDPSLDPADLCASANTGRTHFERRWIGAAETTAELGRQLRAFSEGQPAAGWRSGRAREDAPPKAAFLFTGQGAQYAGMGRRLYETQSLFRDTLRRCDEILAPHMDRSLLSVLYPEPGAESLIDRTEYTQPALFAVDYALAQLWRAWGVEPEALMGHSVGEYAAACVAGVFSLEDGLTLIAARAKLMQALPAGGAMAAVFAETARVRAALEGRDDRVAIAACNGPRHTVVTGEAETVQTILAELAETGVKSKRLNVSHAFHSPLMEPMLDDFARVAAGVAFSEPKLPLIANLTGEPAGPKIATAEYWTRHIRQSVQFDRGVHALRALGCDLFVETGPAPTLLGMARQCLATDDGADLSWAPSLRRGHDDWRALLDGLSTAYARGAAVDWRGFHSEDAAKRTPLPTYPFQRQRYWIQPEAAKPAPPAPSGLAPDNPLLLRRPPAERRRLKTEGAALLIHVSELAHDPELEAGVLALLREHGLGTGCVSQVTGRGFLFINPSATGFYFCNRRDATLIALSYTGPEDRFEETTQALADHCAANGWEVNILEERPPLLGRLAKLGFSTTSVGVWHNVDVAGFTLQGNRMRRLRYLATRYERSGQCETAEHPLGSREDVDAEVIAMIEGWAAGKGNARRLTRHLVDAIRAGMPGSECRAFLTRRDGRLESVILLSPLRQYDGWLMDIEFYRSDMPLGCLEFAIAQTIAQLAGEGAPIFSLGFTPGAQMEPHPNQDDAVREFFDVAHDQDLLNGDANCQFKNKFRPAACAMHLCRPRDLGSAHVGDFIKMMADPVNETVAAPPGGHAVHAGFQELELAIEARVFESRFGLDSQPYLQDHCIQDAVLYPASGFLDAALTVADRMNRDASIGSFLIKEPLRLEAEGGLRLQAVVESSENRTTLKFLSRADSQGQDAWRLHAEAAFDAGDNLSEDEAFDSQAIKARLPETQSGDAFYQRFLELGYAYGPAFRRARDLWFGPREALAELTPSEGSSPADSRFHPALLDACFHVCRMAAPEEIRNGDTVYLPIGVGRFALRHAPTGSLWVHARAQEGGGDTLTVDFDVFDQQNQLIARCRDLLLKKAPRDLWRQNRLAELDDWRWQVAWREASPAAPATAEPETQWLVFADGGGVGAALAQQVGPDRAVLVERGEGFEPRPNGFAIDPADKTSFDRLLAALDGGAALNAVWLWGLDARLPEDAGDVLAQQQDLCGGPLHLVQALAGADRGGQRRVWLATSGAQPADSARGAAAPAQAGLWGFGRVLSLEHPELWGGLIDLGGATEASAARLLHDEILTRDDESLIAYRDGLRLAARLDRPAPSGGEDEPPAFDADGLYLVTGGFGALGLLFAEWLVDRGARRLALLGRREPNDAARARLDGLRAQGVALHCDSIDVADRQQLFRFIDECEAAGAPLRGVIHAAGVLDDGVMAKQSRARLATVLTPKVAGAWNLHALTRDRDLDLFALFSSVASLLGSPGQANYAAANAFMDALAHYRAGQGLPATVVNWGPWAEAGMAAALDDEQRARQAAMGFGEISPQQGLLAMEQALAPDTVQVGVFPFDPLKFADTASGRAPFFRDLVETAKRRQAPAVANAAKPRATRDMLAAASPEEALPMTVDYLRELIAGALGVPADTLPVDKPLNELRLDSLMMMELRGRIISELDVDLPAVRFFESPMIEKLAAEALEQLRAEPAPSEEASGDELDGVAVDNLSDDEVEAMLAQMMDGQGGQP